MAAPYKVYARKVEIGLTAEQLREIDRECALTGMTTSEVIRKAVTRYLMRAKKQRRRAS